MTKHPANEYLDPQEDAQLAFNKWFYEDFYDDLHIGMNILMTT